MRAMSIFFGILWSFHSIQQLLYIFKMVETGVAPFTAFCGCALAALSFFCVSSNYKQKENDNYDD